jgi:hypothetical protein
VKFTREEVRGKMRVRGFLFLKFDSIIISSWQKTKGSVDHFFRETKEESSSWLDGFGFCHSWME